MGLPSAALERLIADLAADAAGGSLAEFRDEALARLAASIGFECGITWSLGEDATVVRGVDRRARDVIRTRRAEFGPTTGRLLAAARSSGGAVSDRDVFSPREMASLPLYTELGPMLGTRDHITVALHLRGRLFGGMYLGRGGARGARFGRDDVDAVRRVVPVLSLAEAAHGPLPAPADDEELRLLTPREREILDLFARGLRYADAASALGISSNTVREHVRSIYAKLGVASKTEAVMRLRCPAGG